jgi:hypothetical protein
MAPLIKARFGRSVMGIVLALLLATSLGGRSLRGTSLAGTSDKTYAAEDKSAVTELQEVKLRKLHLVRPDLIMYPIAYEVFC